MSQKKYKSSKEIHATCFLQPLSLTKMVVLCLLAICFQASVMMAFAPRGLRSLPLHNNNRPMTTKILETGKFPSSIPSTGYLMAEADGSNNDAREEGANDEDDDPLEGMDQQRKENLFQCLLRDLQIEGVPLLDCDVQDVTTLQVAMWTLMATLSTQEQAQRVCLVMEDMSVDALKTFVQDFGMILGQENQPATSTTDVLREQLQRFDIELVGKGVGPAILIETTTNITTGEATPFDSPFSEDEVSSAQKGFMAIEGEENGGTSYRYCGCDEVCHIMSSFWNCICELKATANDEDLNSIVLSLPALNVGTEGDATDDDSIFLAVRELFDRSLRLVRGDDLFEIQSYHDDQQRRQPPFTSVIIKRKSLP